MSNVRTRFCPSPTGSPHVGLVRTCLFSWGYARAKGGEFVFRIEDTDAARDTEESYEQLLEALSWLGMTWDEGPDIGGPHAPYRQSQRLDVYADVLKRLLDGGYAYEAFSTNEEVEARHRAAGRDPKLGYDNFDRDLTEEQKSAFRAEGRKPVLRMRMPNEDITFQDAVRGEVRTPAGTVPDYVIARGDGSPLYTLTNPVDDAIMKVGMVTRGEDLMPSTPRQIVMWRALIALGIADAEPEYAHLPLIVDERGKKMSKRDPRSNLLQYKEAGYLPEGVLNYVATLGWSLSGDRDVFSVAEFLEAFDLHDVKSNPARFDEKKFDAICSDHFRSVDAEELIEMLVPRLQAAGLARRRGDAGAGACARGRRPARAGAVRDARAGGRDAAVPVLRHRGRTGRGQREEDVQGRCGAGARRLDRLPRGDRLDDRGDRGGLEGRPGGGPGSQAPQGLRSGPGGDQRQDRVAAAVRVDGAPGQGREPGAPARRPRDPLRQRKDNGPVGSGGAVGVCAHLLLCNAWYCG